MTQLGPDPVQRKPTHQHRCTACGCEIPPGKAGRKCKDCREGRSVSTSSRSHQTRLEFFDGPCAIRDDINAAIERIRNATVSPTTVVVPAWLIQKLQQQHGDQWESFLRQHLGDATMFTNPGHVPFFDPGSGKVSQ